MIRAKTNALKNLIAVVKHLTFMSDCSIFLLQGHDTVTSATSFTIYEIANHQDIQEKILEELRLVFGENFEEPFTYNNVKNLNYLARVIKEGLRLYPSVAMYQREVTEDVTIGKKKKRKYKGNN